MNILQEEVQDDHDVEDPQSEQYPNVKVGENPNFAISYHQSNQRG
jgi:hypothetical protein